MRTFAAHNPPVRLRRLLPPRLVLLLLIAMIALRLWLPGPDLLPPLVRWPGLPIALLGLIICARSARRFHRVGTNIKTFDDPNRLVTDGWFRLSRNPMYLGFAMLLGGLALAAGGTLTWLPPILFVVAADRIYIPFEERAMRRVFGDAYADYQRRVRRWC
jgi:protein-S-isoprenylcysteine O-methyltransferase Ste14